MPLEEYRSKRVFGQTPEPAGGRVRRAARSAGGAQAADLSCPEARRDNSALRFPVGDRRRPRFWAVPRGPSLNPAEKRLAIMTEDHPLEYADFEGIIPQGHYGAGPVMIWDRGYYQVTGDGLASEQLARGELKFILYATKLRGEFALIHAGARSSSPSRTRQWLLIKRRDEHADPGWNIESVSLDRSVVSSRTLEEIAHHEDRELTAGG